MILQLNQKSSQGKRSLQPAPRAIDLAFSLAQELGEGESIVISIEALIYRTYLGSWQKR